MQASVGSENHCRTSGPRSPLDCGLVTSAEEVAHHHAVERDAPPRLLRLADLG
jgi:hypothetical protein